jgi:hypothetical protein
MRSVESKANNRQKKNKEVMKRGKTKKESKERVEAHRTKQKSEEGEKEGDAPRIQ